MSRRSAPSRPGSPERDPEESYRRVVEAATGHAIVATTVAGHVDSWPDPARELYRYDEDATIGTPIARLWAAEGDAAAVEDLLEAAREGPVDTEAWHRRGDGSVFWAKTTITPMLNEGLHGYTVVTQDITARKQYERMLERQNDRLKEFTDILSHDLRNPLNVVEAYLERYRETGDAEHLATIEETTRRMERLIEDLLSVARQGDVVTDPEPTDLADVVRIAERGTIPDSASLVYDPVPTVMADPDRLCELFENLFRNAVEHGAPTVTVRVGSTEGGFYVEDDGPGIPAEIRSEVFDHGFTTDEDGTGFGLSVVRTIVGAHGWDVAATESADGGARFEITNVQPIDG